VTASVNFVWRVLVMLGMVNMFCSCGGDCFFDSVYISMQNKKTHAGL